MSNNTQDNITVTDSFETVGETIQLPTNFKTVGTVDHDDIKVYVKQSVYKALDAYAHSDTTKELGSILIGNYLVEHGKTHVVISDFIEAKYTDASASTLTFTHETWEYISSEQESKFPKDRIVGWQHTHPGYGIFLSSYDMFIQENFFNLPFQIAYVIDPKQNLDGFFQWKSEKVEKLQGYYVYDDVDVPVEPIQKTKPVKKKKSTSGGKLVVIFCILSVILWPLLLVAMFFKVGDQEPSNSTELVAAVDELQQTVQEQSASISSYAAAVDNLQSQIDELQEDLNTSDAAQVQQEALIEQLQEQIADMDNSGTVYFKQYTVVAGDSLAAICKKNNIDYSTYIEIIVAVNSIDNPSQITVGQMLLLPIPAE